MDSYKEILNQKTKIITLKYFFSVFLQMVTLCVCVCVCVCVQMLVGGESRVPEPSTASLLHHFPSPLKPFL